MNKSLPADRAGSNIAHRAFGYWRCGGLSGPFRDEPDHPRRSYTYVRGTLKLFGGKPEIVVRAADQLSDDPP